MHTCKVLSGIFIAGLGFAFPWHHSFVLQGCKARVWVLEGPASLRFEMLKIFQSVPPAHETNILFPFFSCLHLAEQGVNFHVKATQGLSFHACGDGTSAGTLPAQHSVSVGDRRQLRGQGTAERRQVLGA